MAKARLFLLFFVGLTSSTALLAQTIYRWQDEKGITHFSQQPPSSGNYQLITVQTAGATSATTAIVDNTTATGFDATLCLQAKEQLALLQSEQELFTRDTNNSTNNSTDENTTNSELRLVTADEREQQKLLANFEIKRRCQAYI